MNRASIFAAATAGVFVVTLFGYIGTRSLPRRALPWSAADILEHHVDMFVDYAYYLRARMPLNDFPTYTRRLNLTPYPNAGSPLDRSSDDTPSCWTPGDEGGRVYWRQRGDHFIAATHDGKHVFVQAWSH